MPSWCALQAARKLKGSLLKGFIFVLKPEAGPKKVVLAWVEFLAAASGPPLVPASSRQSGRLLAN
jgi:hypothetical protein